MLGATGGDKRAICLTFPHPSWTPPGRRHRPSWFRDWHRRPDSCSLKALLMHACQSEPPDMLGCVPAAGTDIGVVAGRGLPEWAQERSAAAVAAGQPTRA